MRFILDSFAWLADLMQDQPRKSNALKVWV
jgi:hypothetical protein